MRNVVSPFGPFRFVVIAIPVWMNQEHQYAIDYLREDNRVLRAQFGGLGLRCSDDQRRCRAAKGKLIEWHCEPRFAWKQNVPL